METSSESESWNNSPRRSLWGGDAPCRPSKDIGRTSDQEGEISTKFKIITKALKETNRELTKVDQKLNLYRDQTEADLAGQILKESNKTTLERQVSELKRAMDQKEQEKDRLNNSLDKLSSELKELREIQNREQTERRKMEALLLERTRSRDKIKSVALKAIRHWRAKCKRLDKTQLQTEKALQAAREKESFQDQLNVLSQKTNAACTELNDILSCLAKHKEELHNKHVELTETSQQQLSLKQETQEVRQALAALKEEKQSQVAIQAWVKEHRKQEEQTVSRVCCCQRVQDMRGEFQAAPEQMTPTYAQLAQQLANEENSSKGLQRSSSELQAKLIVALEGRAVLEQQLQLEREVHHKNVHNMKAISEASSINRNHEVQAKMQAHLKEVKASGESDKELCGVLRATLSRTKDESDKMAAQLRTKDEAYALLQRKYQQLQQDLDAQLAQQLANENSSKGLQRSSSELQAKLIVALEERAVLEQQLQLEREVHHKNVHNMKAISEASSIYHDHEVQAKMQAHLKEVKASGESDKELCGVLHATLSRMKDESDKMAAQLRTKDEAYALLQRTDQQLQQELDDQLAQQLANEENSSKELQRSSSELQAKLTVALEERAVLEQQLQLEREVHHKNMHNMKAISEASSINRDHEVQAKMQAHLKEVRASGESDKELCGVLHATLSRMKDESDKMAAQLRTKDEAYALLQRTYQQLQQELDDQLAQQLANEENSSKELQRSSSELQAKLTVALEERAVLEQQLQLEREVHHKNVHNMKAISEASSINRDHEVQAKMQAHLKEVKASGESDKELCGVLHATLSRMKDESDKMAAQLRTTDETYALLQRKYQQLQLEEKIRSGDQRHISELEEKVLQMAEKQKQVLTIVGEELDATCLNLASNCEYKQHAISQDPTLVKNIHHWLAETMTKLRWLCEEVRECGTREESLRKQHQQTRDQLNVLKQMWETCLDQLEKRSSSTERNSCWFRV